MALEPPGPICDKIASRRLNARRTSARASGWKATRARVLCLVGLSPAVVTETLWALAVRQRPRVLADELHIVTTRAGLAEVASTLLGQRGALARLRQTYRLPADAFRCPPAHLHVLANVRGEPLDDILTSRDSEAVGEQIGDLIREFTGDEDVALHASLAGGRKTMGALLAAAFQLHGRSCDHLYHVLVSPPFDEVRDFFFPTRAPLLLQWRDASVDARKAGVMLVEIPLVRLGGAVRQLGMTQLGLSRLAAEMEAEASGRLTLDPLVLDARGGTVRVGGACVKPVPQQMALYLLYATSRRACARGRCRGGDRCDRCHLTDDQVHDRREQLLGIYEAVRERGGGSSLEGFTGPRTDDLQEFRAWLQQTRSRLNRTLRAALGRGPRGQRYLVSEMTSDGARRRGLALPPRLVTVIGLQA